MKKDRSNVPGCCNRLDSAGLQINYGIHIFVKKTLIFEILYSSEQNVKHEY